MKRPIRALGMVATVLTSGLATSQQLRLDELHRMLPAEARDTFHRLGDVEGDGDLDLLLFRSEGPTAVALARNDGRGAFNEPVAFVLPSSPSPFLTWLGTVLLNDVDGDGDMDAFLPRAAWELDTLTGVLTPTGAQDLLYRNNGSAFSNVTASQMPALLDQTFAAASADVDGDGDVDFVIGNEFQLLQTPYDGLARNDGNGFFAAASGALPALTGRTDIIGVSDVDLDGDLDLLLRKVDFQSHDHVLINDGGGTFANESFRLPALPDSLPLVLADLDGDSDPDALSASTRLENDGLGFFTVVSGGLPAGAPSALPKLADVNEDGLLDAFVSSSLDALRLYIGDGSSFAEVVVPQGIGPPAGVQVGDVDRDGDLDAVLASKSQADLLLGDGTGQFLASSSVFEGLLALPGGNGGALRDMNADGHLDLVLASTEAPSLRMLFGSGTGDFADATASLSVVPGKFRAPAAADAEGDGDPDLFVGAESGTNRLLLNDGNGSLAEVAGAFPEPSSCQSVALADLDSDGFVDVLFGQSFTIPTRLYLNDGLGGFVLAPSLPFSGAVNDCLAADLDGNGTRDLLVVASNDTYGLLNDGSASFTPGILSSARGTCVAASDAEGDGDVDLALGTGRGESNQFLRNNGSGGFTGVNLPSSTRRSMSVAFLELDGDGRQDLYFANWDGGASSLDQLLRHTGGISTYADISSQLGARIDELSWEVLVGDVDEDGDEDAVVVGGRAILPYPELLGVTRVYSNLYRQLTWRSVPSIGKQLVLDQHGTPGGPYWLLAALAPGELELPPLGTLRVDPATFVIFASGVLDADGRSTFVLPIPRLPGLVGLSLYFQSALGQPILFSNLEQVEFTAF